MELYNQTTTGNQKKYQQMQEVVPTLTKKISDEKNDHKNLSINNTVSKHYYCLT